MQRSKPVFVYSTEPFAGGSFNSALSLIDTFEKENHENLALTYVLHRAN